MRDKTTKKHFELFKSEVLKWLNTLGIKGWRLHFYHEDSDDTAGCWAIVRYKTVDRVAEFVLARTWTSEPLDHEVAQTAFHECLELLLAPLVNLARERYVSENAIVEETHHVIRTIENTFYPDLVVE
ncbi:MAG: hypothetical protein KKB20_11525 [Proteobacteria bacterium]|nr:hypothetical protein [Pseudomonadota bacterium]